MANLNLNQIILGGRLVADPEIKQTQNGISVCSFRIAVNRRVKSADGKTEADFFNCTAWRGTAETVAGYFHKASNIAMTGSVQNRSYTDKDGQKRTITEIQVDQVYFVDGKDEPSTTAPSQTATNYGEPAQANFESVPTDDNLPF